MATTQAPSKHVESPEDQGGSVGVNVAKPRVAPARPRVDRLPPWKVLLHNDDRNDMGYVVETIMTLTALNAQAAIVRMAEAHKTGVALLVSTHREHAELLCEQFTSKRLIVTIEPE